MHTYSTIYAVTASHIRCIRTHSFIHSSTHSYAAPLTLRHVDGTNCNGDEERKGTSYIHNFVFMVHDSNELKRHSLQLSMCICLEQN